MAFLRSLLFALIFYPATLLVCLFALIVAPFGQAPLREVVHFWAKFHYWLVQHVVGIRFEWDGELPNGPYLVAVKHESMVEAVDTLRFAHTPVVVMKRELTTMPLWGWVARRYGVIGVDRKAGASALRTMMKEAKAAAKADRPVIIFPEGTRIPHGERPKLRPGFAGLYKMLGLPVIPIAQDSGSVWPRGFVKHPGTIQVKIGEVIPPGLPRKEVEARVHEAINLLN
ncbi:lysophospholipid acyltransferase family protein [Sphingomicrobium clamense]|uniref:1-acyl-sn-glycerol-3-phosphate acyltransferase n=1 Tax=Sphingomicrobium clamense TaxID=2851013 RepID=A0ABS6V2X0_9SPHN|nr:lysophospholipid acyltransferase family protein [Sphingomicrobium sp. B8]MBW0143910.1 1-acyl-sn-glycerol-3-phosphate acyltransferase [Sphingomicrobium sp. B8]